jgi:hypothetical protein
MHPLGQLNNRSPNSPLNALDMFLALWHSPQSSKQLKSTKHHQTLTRPVQHDISLAGLTK